MQAKRQIEKMLPPAKIKHTIDIVPNEPVSSPPIHKNTSVLNEHDLLVERALNMPFPLSHDVFQFNLDTLLDESVYVAQLATYFPKLDSGEIEADEYAELANAIAILQRLHKDTFAYATPIEDIPACSPASSLQPDPADTPLLSTPESTLSRVARVALNTLIAPQCLWKALVW